MLVPPSLKWCHVRERWIISWPQVWFREVQMSADAEILDEFAQQMAAQIMAGPPPPEPDAEGMVKPAYARHMPNNLASVPLAEIAVFDDPDAVWCLAEPVEAIS